MNSREIVRRTLEFDKPERVARSFRGSDFHSVGCHAETLASDWVEVEGKHWHRTDAWGNLWARIDTSSKGEVIAGALDDMSEIASYEFPDFSQPSDYAHICIEKQKHPDKWVIGAVPGFAFSIARKLRKLDQYLMDLMLEKELMHALHDRIDRLIEDMIRNYADVGVDSIMFAEDWGTQDQTLISPALWYEEFFPRHQKLCKLAHEVGIKVIMHSCGMIEAIVPGLIEAGVDVLQFDQPDLHGIDTLATYQQDEKITFWCPVDIQRTLQTCNENVIRAKASEMLEKLWKGRGGFIAGYYPDNESLGLNPKWQEIACDVFLNCGIESSFARYASKANRKTR